MYYPKFTITAEILENIGQIEASRAIIDNAPLVPAYEKSFRHEATARKFIAFDTGTVMNHSGGGFMTETFFISRDKGGIVNDCS